MSGTSKKIKIPMLLGIIVLCLSIGGLSGFAVYKKNSGKSDKSLIQKESNIVTINLEEILESASDLVSLKYYYTDADTYSNSKKAFGKKIPLTTDKVVFKYSGVVSAGIDISLVQYEIDDEKKEITLSLPEPKIISHEIDEDSFEFFDVKNSVFTETKFEDYTSMVADLKEDKEEYLEEDGEFYKEVLDNAKDVLKNFVTAPEQTKDYNVIFVELKTDEDEPVSEEE